MTELPVDDDFGGALLVEAPGGAVICSKTWRRHGLVVSVPGDGEPVVIRWPVSRERADKFQRQAMMAAARRDVLARLAGDEDE